MAVAYEAGVKELVDANHKGHIIYVQSCVGERINFLPQLIGINISLCRELTHNLPQP
jgi:hypothetical protein